MKFPRLLLLLALLCALPASAQTLYIAAASDLVFCLDEMNAAFRKLAPAADLKVTAGSSGNFFAQIKNGAPYEVYLSADMQYPKDLAKDGFADLASLTPYAIGRIVLWTVNPQIDVSRGLAVLTDPAVKRIAIANPEHAPYGRAAKAAIEAAGLWNQVSARIVMGENISQTAQFVQTGNAEAGLVALSLVKATKMAGIGNYFLIPASVHPALAQGAILTTKGVANPLARQYMQFLRSAEARVIFDRYGFTLPAVNKAPNAVKGPDSGKAN